MNKSIFLRTALCVVAVVVLFQLLIYASRTISQKPTATTKTPSPTAQIEQVEHSSHLFDQAFFDQASQKAQPYIQTTSRRVFGGIVPHHLLAAPLIQGFFDGIRDQEVTTIILLSPNHYGVGPYSVATSKGIWKTLFGEIQPDTAKIDQLEREGAASVYEDLFETEHGINNITSFMKKTFPTARIIPIAIQSGTSKEKSDALVQSLSKIYDEHTLVLVSADFSHYLPLDQAHVHDQESLSALRAFDTERLRNLDHVKNVDTPESVSVLAELMKQKHADVLTLLAHSNSATLTGEPDIQSTTSYFTMYFSQQKDALSENTIFQYVDPSTLSAARDNPNTYTIIATGDVMPARSVNSTLIQRKNFTYPYEKTVDVLKNADAVFINLETPLVPYCEPTTEGMIFCGDQRNIDGLTYADVTIANVANNHMGNYGIDGVQATIKLLDQHNILVTGNERPALLTIKGKKFGFLGYNSIGTREVGVSWAESERIHKDIEALKQRVDVVVVAFHWGVEYTSTPTSYQRGLAHEAIDAGADLIIGNHPHWVQGIEQYKGKFITYSHGNFVFDQMWSQETREGVLGRYTFDDQGLVDVRFVPTIIENYAQPRFANEAEATNILNRMKQSTDEISRRNTEQ